MKVDRHFPDVIFKRGRYQRHVARTCPTGKIVLRETRESATGHDRLNSGLKNCRENGIVAAQRMTDAADSGAVHFRHRFQQIDGSRVIPDRLHRAALVLIGIKIVRVFAE